MRSLLEALLAKDQDNFRALDEAATTLLRDLAAKLASFVSLPVKNVKDPLKWWYDNHFVYPSLHRMALDYLSIPATSTAVERVFSQGRHLLPFMRNNLSLGSI